MRRIMSLIGRLTALAIVVCMTSSALFAQEGEMDANMKAESEMKAALGTVPVMMKLYPEGARAAAWDWFKTMQRADAAISPKYMNLIALAVSAQIPCQYCVYAHTQMAKAAGATDEEIHEAIASAAEVRHWSTVLNGNGVNFEEFKAEWDGIMAYMAEQSKMQKEAGGGN